MKQKYIFIFFSKNELFIKHLLICVFTFHLKHFSVGQTHNEMQENRGFQEYINVEKF
jgi:hypothetical protein